MRSFIGVQEPLKPVRFSDGGSRQMIVMPVRVDANATASDTKSPASKPFSPITPAPASMDTKPDPPTTINPNPHHQPEERNQSPTQNPTTTSYHGNGQSSIATNGSSATGAEAESSLEQAFDQVEALKAGLRGAVGGLNTLAETLCFVQRERRLSEREVRSVRDTLKSLQTVRL